MIPRTLHYCWFGRGGKPKSVLKCIATWREKCPDYTIKEWNEDNFDVRRIQYTSQAYDAKKYAFVSDCARLHALYTDGGIYMDTDVEVVKSFDDMLHHTSFIGFESPIHLQTGVMASEAGVKWCINLLEEYTTRRFILPNGKIDTTTNVVKTTDYFTARGLRKDGSIQDVGSCAIYPEDYFCAKDHRTGIITKSENTYTIHHYEGSWNKSDVQGNLRHSLKLLSAKLLGGDTASFIADIITLRRFKSK